MRRTGLKAGGPRFAAGALRQRSGLRRTSVIVREGALAYTVRMRVRRWLTWSSLCALVLAADAGARTVHRCVRDGTVSLATAPEPGSNCKPIEIDDRAPLLPNLWGALGTRHGFLYARQQDGRTVLSTRDLPGSTRVQAFTLVTPEPDLSHPGVGRVGKPRLDRFPAQFQAAAKSTGVEDAWLRAIAHAESYFDPAAVSGKGAQGVMQLMPETARQYGVTDPFSSAQSIRAGARHLKNLDTLYDGDRVLVAAAYNAGVAAVTRHEGVPPFPETQVYVAKVHALYARYRAALSGPTPP